MSRNLSVDNEDSRGLEQTGRRIALPRSSLRVWRGNASFRQQRTSGLFSYVREVPQAESLDRLVSDRHGVADAGPHREGEEP
jgi:hypothetical protein